MVFTCDPAAGCRGFPEQFWSTGPNNIFVVFLLFGSILCSLFTCSVFKQQGREVRTKAPEIPPGGA